MNILCSLTLTLLNSLFGAVDFSSTVGAVDFTSTVPVEPNWQAAIATTQARIGQPFVIDGVGVQVDRVASVLSFADGTAPDNGARVVEVEFWLHNAQADNIDLYDRFYAYASLGDGTDTNGEGLSYFPLDSAKEISNITLKPSETAHARFDLEVPINMKLTALVIYGPIDGATVTIKL